MRPLRYLLVGAVLFGGGALVGCGEDQPNAAAQPQDLGPDFAKKTADMMKSANSGMDPKQAKKPHASK